MIGRIALILVLLTLASCVEPIPTSDPAPKTHTSSFELEDAIVENGFIVAANATASSGAYLEQPTGVENRRENIETARIEMSVPRDDTYTLWIRMYGPSSSQDAAYAGIDGNLTRIYPTGVGRYEWIDAGNWTLTEAHAISIGYGESGARLDLAVLTSEDLSPAELDEYVIIEAASEPVCGNGIVEEGEACDTGTACGDSTCTCECTVPSDPNLIAARSFSLRGDSSFSIDNLDPEARIWHERLIRGFESQDPQYSYNAASSDSLYLMGRQAHTHIQSLLWAMRATGDLRILDEVDLLAQDMRATLSDSWCAPEPDPRYGYVGADGYENWRQRSSDTLHNCRDVHKLDESKTHGLVATLAYAYEINRDLESPSGVDYAERADFWKDYLFNEYEAKWQSRFGREDALTRVEGFDSGHPQMTNAKMHYYMYKLSGDEKYLERSIALSTPVIESMRISPTDAGDAYVWSQRWRTEPQDGFNLQATTYARYVFADFAELHVEGVEPWDTVDMTRYANTFTQYIMDDGSSSFARDIGGGIERAGIPPIPEGERSRFNAKRYAISPYVMVFPWDETGKGERITEEVYASVESDLENPEHLYIPAAMVFYHEWRAVR